MALADQPDVTDAISTSAEAHEASALPCANVIHTEPQAKPTPEIVQLPESVRKESVEAKSPAHWAYERLVLYIQNFEQQLDDTHEVAMGFTGGDAGVLRIEGIGYFSPDIITFYGSDDSGARRQLIQHVGQLNVMLVAMPKAPEVEAPRRIGFRLAAGLDEERTDTA